MAGIPQVITEDRASGAQVIDGSLKFDWENYNRLQRTQVGGSRKTFTWSGWIKDTDYNYGNDNHDWFSANEGNTTGGVDYGFGVRFPYHSSHSSHSNQLMVFEYENSAFKMRLISEQKFRDFNQFYHLVVAVDTTIASPASDRVKVYVNGERITDWKSGYESYPSQNLELTVSESGKTSHIGCSLADTSVAQMCDGYASNFYLIDGQQLGPEEFGFTDPLTNTWRPKRYDKSGPNNGTTWSSSGSSSASLQNGSWSQVFDGTQYMYSGSGASNGPALANGSITFAPSGLSGRVITAGVRGGGNKTYTVNGQAMTFGSSSAEVATIDLGSTQTIASVVGTSTASGTWAQFFWIAVDGVLLVDGLNDLKAFGKNGFYLPMDGNTPIGKDQSGRGNDFTPKRFGGSVDLPKATGALPILNTNDAGTVAKLGVRTDKKTYTVTASGGNYYLDGALKPTLNAYRGGSYTFDYTGATSHPFYLSSLQDGKWNSKAYSVEFDGTDDTCSIGPSSDFTMGTGDFTIECFVQKDNNSHKGILQISDTAGGFATSNYGTTLAIGYQSGVWQIYGTGNSTPSAESPDYPINAGQWYHVAYVRNNGIAKLYVDGMEVISRSDTYNYNGTYIGYGGYYNNGYYHDGKISNLRVVKGQALYTSNFTRPSTTLTTTSQGAIASNVKLICCQDSDATTAAVKPGDITVNGGSVARNESPFLYNTNGQEGVNTGTSNTTKITIPHWAADTLYYYCNAHSGMGSSINVTTDIFKADPYAWKCTLALPCLGNANDVSYLINCNATELPIVPQANAHADFSTGNFYGGSYDLDGSGDYINVNSSSPYSHVNFGYNDYTAECWVYLDGTGDEYVFNMSTNNGGAAPHWNINFYSTNLIRAGRTDGSGNSRHQISYDFPRNKWMHIAISRGGFTSKLFLDGVLIDSRFDDDGIVPIGNLNIGAYNNGGAELNGFVQDARIYNGVAKYTESFVVGSTAPDVLPDTPSGISGKSKLTKITEGAVAFDGSADFLQIPASEDLNVGTADFTAEAWVYPTTYGEIVGAFNLNSPYNGWLWSLSFGSLGKQMIWFDGNQQESTSVVPKNKWSHIAFSKSGTTVKYFLDGKLDGSFTASANSTWSNQAVNIGADSNSLTSPGRNFHGFISNLRLIKGTALYTSDFTPPTEQLTEVTNTKLLCCQSNNQPGGAAVLPYDITVTSSNNGNGSVGSLSAITSTGSNYYLDYRTVGRAWVQLDFASTQSSVTSIKFSGGGYEAGALFDFYVNGVLVANDRTTQTLWAEDTITISSTDINSIRIDGVDGYAIGAVKFNDTLVSGTIGGITANGDAAATNFNPFTDDINAIRGQASGYATLNPLNVTGTLSDGNLSFYRVAKGGTTSTIGVESGKIYVEAKGDVGSGGFGFGFVQSNYNNDGSTDIGDATNSFGIRAVNTGATFKVAGGSSTGITKSTTANTIYAFAVDFDTGLVNLLIDGVIVHTQTLSLASGTYCVAVASETSSATKNVHVNFGQKPFKFPPPDGFQPLNLSNVQPEKVIARPDQYVKATTYTGDGSSSGRSINIGFRPDLIWLKSRGSGDHGLYDSVRGPDKRLRSNGVGGEDTVVFPGASNFGFDFGSETYYNGSSVNYVAWTWKAGGNKNTFNVDDVGYATASAAGLTAGTITPTGASVGTKQGFSIVKFTGDSTTTGSIAHGLNKKPQFVVVRDLVNNDDWQIKFVDENRYLKFNTTDAGSTSYSNYTATDSVINLGYTWNNDSSPHIAYSWHDVPGLQKFGTYTGNGSADGPFIELGFQPAIIWMKNISDGSNRHWCVVDSTRSTYNKGASAEVLFFDSNQIESRPDNGFGQFGSKPCVDILSNGFKLREANTNNVWTQVNNTHNYIYCAWAEAPSINLYGAQSNAF